MPDIVPSASSSSKAVKPKEQFIGTTSSASAGSASKQKKGLKPPAASSNSVCSQDGKKKAQQDGNKRKKRTKNNESPPPDETKSKPKADLQELHSSQPRNNSPPAPRLPTTKPLLPPCLEELRTTKNHLQPVDADRIDDPNLKLDAAGVPVVLKSLRETRSNDNHNRVSSAQSSTANKFLSAKQRRHLTVLSKNLGPLDHDRRRLIKQWTAVLFPLVDENAGGQRQPSGASLLPEKCSSSTSGKEVGGKKPEVGTTSSSSGINGKVNEVLLQEPVDCASLETKKNKDDLPSTIKNRAKHELISRCLQLHPDDFGVEEIEALEELRKAMLKKRKARAQVLQSFLHDGRGLGLHLLQNGNQKQDGKPPQMMNDTGASNKTTTSRSRTPEESSCATPANLFSQTQHFFADGSHDTQTGNEKIMEGPRPGVEKMTATSGQQTVAGDEKQGQGEVLDGSCGKNMTPGFFAFPFSSSTSSQTPAFNNTLTPGYNYGTSRLLPFQNKRRRGDIGERRYWQAFS